MFRFACANIKKTRPFSSKTYQSFAATCAYSNSPPASWFRARVFVWCVPVIQKGLLVCDPQNKKCIFSLGKTSYRSKVLAPKSTYAWSGKERNCQNEFNAEFFCRHLESTFGVVKRFITSFKRSKRRSQSLDIDQVGSVIYFFL